MKRGNFFFSLHLMLEANDYFYCLIRLYTYQLFGLSEVNDIGGKLYPEKKNVVPLCVRLHVCMQYACC